MEASGWAQTALTLWGARRRIPADPISGFLDQVQATPLCRIGVFGPGAGEALPRLWRRGYSRAQAGRCGHPTPRDGEILHDVVWVSESTCATSALKSVTNALPGLRAGGEVVIGLDRMDTAEAAALRQGLRELGMRPVRVLRPQHHAVAAKIERAEAGPEAGLPAQG